MTYTEKLPPLPEPAYVSHDIPLFSSFQMMDYAQAALDALADEAEASIKEMIDAGLGQLPKQEPVAWQAVGGSIWGHKTSEDDRPLYTEGNWNEGYKHGLWQGQNCAKPTTIAEWWAEKQTASGEPDMKHPKIQALIGGKARREIELQIVEQLLDDPDCDLSAMDMEYWHGLHDKLREKLLAAQPAPAASVPSVPVAWLELRTLSSGGYASPIKEWHATQNPSTSNAPRKPLYTSPQPAPAGWQLVPVEPTPAMLEAGAADGRIVNGRPLWKLTADVQARERYTAMLDAAPAAPDAQKGAA